MAYSRSTFPIIVLILIAQFALVSCSNAATEDAQPNIGLGDEYINNQVTINAPEFFNSFHTTDAIILQIQSATNHEIQFSKDYSLRIFKKTNHGWVELQEKPVTRLPEDDIIFSPNALVSDDLAVFPDLGDYSQSYHLRIYVFGDMTTEQGIEKVSAFIDVQLQPG